MDTPVTLEHLSPEMVEQTLDRIRSFNAGRTDAHGTYVISLATSFRPYYSLWRIFHDRQAPLFIRTLAVTFDAAVERAIVLLQNCNVILEYRDNSFLNRITVRVMTLFRSGSTAGNEWRKSITLSLLTFFG